MPVGEAVPEKPGGHEKLIVSVMIWGTLTTSLTCWLQLPPITGLPVLPGGQEATGGSAVVMTGTDSPAAVRHVPPGVGVPVEPGGQSCWGAGVVTMTGTGCSEKPVVVQLPPSAVEPAGHDLLREVVAMMGTDSLSEDRRTQESLGGWVPVVPGGQTKVTSSVTVTGRVSVRVQVPPATGVPEEPGGQRCRSARRVTMTGAVWTVARCAVAAGVADASGVAAADGEGEGVLVGTLSAINGVALGDSSTSGRCPSRPADVPRAHVPPSTGMPTDPGGQIQVPGIDGTSNAGTVSSAPTADSCCSGADVGAGSGMTSSDARGGSCASAESSVESPADRSPADDGSPCGSVASMGSEAPGN